MTYNPILGTWEAVAGEFQIQGLPVLQSEVNNKKIRGYWENSLVIDVCPAFNPHYLTHKNTHTN